MTEEVSLQFKGLIENLLVIKETLDKSHIKNWLADQYTPLEIEIGCGSGKLISRLAGYNSNNRYIGIDINKDQCISAVKRISLGRLSNVIIINMEANEFFSHYVPSNSVSSVHIYFPTPYPDKIRLKKRLIDENFLSEVYRVLVFGGILRIATDHAEYYGKIYQYLHKFPWWHVPWSSPLPVDEGLLIGTDCELKYSSISRIKEIQVLK